MSDTIVQKHPVILLPDMEYPAEYRDLYRRRGYWTEETFPDLIASWSRKYADRPAVIVADEVWDYSSLLAEAERFANVLSEAGVGSGQAVVLHLPNGIDFLLALIATMQLGAVPALAMPAHTQKEIAHVIRTSEAVAFLGWEGHKIDGANLQADFPELRLLIASNDRSYATDFVSTDTGQPIDIRQARRSSGDVALLLLSGGTTGLPKLIARTHADYIYNIRASAARCGLTSADRYLAALPMGHNFPLGCPGVLATFECGGCVVLPVSPAPEEAFAALSRHQATVAALVPSLADLWLQALEWEQADLSSLRLLQVGGAKLDEQTAIALLKAFPSTLQQVFGMAEGLLNFTDLNDPQEVVTNSQGRPLCPDDEIRVVDADGCDVNPGEVGELLVRGPYTIRGYYRAPEENRTAFTPEGYYRSGDLVRHRADGNLVVEGRSKDVIVRNGENITAGEVEALLKQHPAVRDAAVFAGNLGTKEEKIHAALVCGTDVPDLKEVRVFFDKLGVPRSKWPERLFIVGQLPLTPVGKVDKRALAAQTGSE